LSVQKKKAEPLVSEGVVPGLLSIAQSAHYLNLARCTIYTLLSKGCLRSVRYGRRRLIPTTELNRYIDRLIEEQMGGKDDDAA
jgi:excisionase family DNA binding protein